jgi:5-methylcytosine-specific restriction endonuclease McrA
VKRSVWARDGGRCGFVGSEGRCAERGFLEYHHAVPYADGGAATEANIQLRCRAHNQYEADEGFGSGISWGRVLTAADNSLKEESW